MVELDDGLWPTTQESKIVVELDDGSQLSS